MTYAEGAALHPERGGSAVLGRYAFNELVSFIAGWAIVLDYTILLAVAALTVPAYLAAFWSPLGHGAPQILIALGVIAFVALDNLTGVKVRPLRRRIAITIADIVLQALVIVLGLVLVFHPHRLSETVHLGTAPTWSGLAYAFPIGVIAFTGLEAAASLAGEVNASVAQLRRLVIPGSAVIVADLRRDRDRRDLGAPGPPRHQRPWGQAPQRAGARNRRVLQTDLGGRRAQVRRRDRRRARAHRRRRGSDARRLPCRLLAGDQPPDPERDRTAQPAVGDAVRRDRRRRAGGRRARAPERHRAARRDLRVRRAARVHDRPRFGDRAALPRARSPAGLPGPAVDPHPRCEGAAADVARGGARGGRRGRSS